MSITRLDDKCINCKLCVRDCVAGVWRVVDGKPTPVAPDLCNRCSHCIAVCPRDAILHSALDASQSVRVNKDSLQPNVYRDIILSRRSIRHYKDTPIPRGVIEQVLDLARYAPTASNDQNVGYVVITDKKLIERTAQGIFRFVNGLHERTKSGIGRFIVNATGLSKNRYIRLMDYTREETKSGRDFILHNAPVLILLHAPSNARFGRDNCAIAATTIINYVHALGMGTCYIGLLTLLLRFSKNLRNNLSVPKGRKVYACLVMGYPAYTHANTVSRKKPSVQWL
jgi:nitroreductase/NAD-dependent dihydropyrimidine dehydrogenase PreA subunit